MNKILRKILFVLLYPFTRIIRLIQDKMDFLRTYKLKLIIAKIMRIIRLFNGSAASVQFPDAFYPAVNQAGNTQIVVIDHSYHYRTRSSSFFITLLQQLGSVRVVWDSQWNGGKFPAFKRIDDEPIDLLILWQIMIYHDPRKLKKLNCKNIIIIPMFDDIHADPDELFLRFGEFRFISFCRELQQRFDRIGIRSRYFQYFMDPSELEHHEEPFSELKGFLWQRTNDITWDHVRKLIEGSEFASFHLHLALDPIWYREVLPTEAEMKKYHITITRWFEKKEDFLSVLSRANVFFTPRLYEGIGMPVIEAMLQGKLVVSPDHPTMNEYIVHGRNGMLYDVQDLKPLDFTNAGTMAARAREDSLNGYDNWDKEKPDILEYLGRENSL